MFRQSRSRVYVSTSRPTGCGRGGGATSNERTEVWIPALQSLPQRLFSFIHPQQERDLLRRARFPVDQQPRESAPPEPERRQRNVGRRERQVLRRRRRRLWSRQIRVRSGSGGSSSNRGGGGSRPQRAQLVDNDSAHLLVALQTGAETISSTRSRSRRRGGDCRRRSSDELLCPVSNHRGGRKSEEGREAESEEVL